MITGARIRLGSLATVEIEPDGSVRHARPLDLACDGLAFAARLAVQATDPPLGELSVEVWPTSWSMQQPTSVEWLRYLHLRCNPDATGRVTFSSTDPECELVVFQGVQPLASCRMKPASVDAPETVVALSGERTVSGRIVLHDAALRDVQGSARLGTGPYADVDGLDFRFDHVPPGHYLLRVRVGGRRTDGGVEYLDGSGEIVVGDEDIKVELPVSESGG